MGYLLALGLPQKPAGSVKCQAKLLVFLALMFLWLINLYDKTPIFHYFQQIWFLEEKVMFYFNMEF